MMAVKETSEMSVRMEGMEAHHIAMTDHKGKYNYSKQNIKMKDKT